MTRSPASPLTASGLFRFRTSLSLQESTGLRAATLPQLLRVLRQVPDSCIYHHTHDFLLSHHYLTPEPTNDFAYWVSEVLGEHELGETLAGIDILAYPTLQRLREVFVQTIERYLQAHPTARLRFVSEGAEFFFLKSLSVVLPTPYQAATLAEFAQALEHVSIHVLYYHIFTARLRLGRPTNDFTVWLTEQLGLQELGEAVARLDPYAHTLETLRGRLLAMIRRQLTVAAPVQDSPHA